MTGNLVEEAVCLVKLSSGSLDGLKQIVGFGSGGFTKFHGYHTFHNLFHSILFQSVIIYTVEKGDIMFGLQASVLLTYAGAVLLLFLLGKIFLWPLKLILKLVMSSVIGGVILLAVNLVAGTVGLVLIPLNLITALAVGILGIPGVILLLILFLI